MPPREHAPRREAPNRSLNLLAAALLAAVVTLARDAHACTCEGPEPTLLSPAWTNDVPSNTKVRVELLTDVGADTRVVLRTTSGATVETTTRAIGDDPVNVIELTPVAPLAASTRYEVMVVDPRAHPPKHVFATFATNAVPLMDTTAPRIDTAGAIRVEKFSNTRPGGSCSMPGPWVALDIGASDPGRPSAKLLYGVWLDDPTKPPLRILDHAPDSLVVGQAWACRRQGFPFPSKGPVTIAIAAIDEAGNASEPKKLRADFTTGSAQWL